METQRKKLSVFVSDQAHEDLRILAARRRVSLQGLFEQIIEASLSGATDLGTKQAPGVDAISVNSETGEASVFECKYTYPVDHEPDHRKLDRILRLGGKYRAIGIRSNLDAFVGDMKHDHPEVKDAPASKRPTKRVG